MAEQRKTLGLPTTLGISDTKVKHLLDRMIEQMELREGLRQNPGERAVTYDELVQLQADIGNLETALQARINRVTGEVQVSGRPQPVPRAPERALSVDTDDIVNRAVTSVVQSLNAGALALPTTYTTVARAVLNLAERAPVHTIFNAKMDTIVNGASAVTGWITVRITRNGTVIDETGRMNQSTTAGNYADQRNSTFTFARIDTLSAGTYTYEVDARRQEGPSATVTASVSDRNIVLLVLKR